jgi:hypothetical protein
MHFSPPIPLSPFTWERGRKASFLSLSPLVWERDGSRSEQGEGKNGVSWKLKLFFAGDKTHYHAHISAQICLQHD